RRAGGDDADPGGAPGRPPGGGRRAARADPAGGVLAPWHNPTEKESDERVRTYRAPSPRRSARPRGGARPPRRLHADGGRRDDVAYGGSGYVAADGHVGAHV